MDRFILKANKILVFVAGVFLVAMIVLTCSNIFLRIIWVPVRGTFELMGFMGAIVTSFALGYTQMTKGHICVDILFRKFSGKTIKILTCVNNIICMLFFMIIAWQLADKGLVMMETGEVTETLRIIYHPFIFGVAIGCSFLSIVFFAEVVRIIFPKKEKKS